MINQSKWMGIPVAVAVMPAMLVYGTASEAVPDDMGR
jgi:hypothetical protein